MYALWYHANEAIKIEYPEWIERRRRRRRKRQQQQAFAEPFVSHWEYVKFCGSIWTSPNTNFISATELTNRIIFTSNMIITNDDVMLMFLAFFCVRTLFCCCCLFILEHVFCFGHFEIFSFSWPENCSCQKMKEKKWRESIVCSIRSSVFFTSRIHGISLTNAWTKQYNWKTENAKS